MGRFSSCMAAGPLLLALLVSSGCAQGHEPGCETSADCEAGLLCVGGECFTPAVDAGGSPDAGLDAGPRCDDGLHNGDESDRDCGGTCSPCLAGASCGGDGDCATGLCTAAVCVEPACDDGAQNGDESDIDCGGSCPPCEVGDACTMGIDCTTLSCRSGSCAAPACDDGVRNGDEPDIDCGGACPPCGECGGCGGAADCEQGRCAGGFCRLLEEIYVDWVVDCSADGSSVVTRPDTPAGRYRVTALMSGGTVWNGPWSPPTRGWYYRIECQDFPVPTVATPSGIYYANADTAFASLMATTEDVDYAGGTLACDKRDSACTDNAGGVRFQIERLCP